jgi:hypothetical protein
MKNIYALLVGINDYPSPVSSLRGCLNDLKSFRDYLEANFQNDRFKLHLRTLEDEAATRANIIAGFDYFEAAEDGDTCVFFFAGHGSRFLAPEAFWQVESDRMNESLVCYDSRMEGGRELIDKELSYLIWRATKDKNIHFLAVTDCCHSGSNTRMEKEGVRVRRAGTPGAEVLLEDYLGYEDYPKTDNGALTPPRGRHVHLAACRPYQTAKEAYPNGLPRGVFTYCLVEAWAGSRNRISYAELVSRLDFRMRHLIENQSPHLDAIFTDDKQLNMLTGGPVPPHDEYLIGYDDKLGWVLDAGALHGITPSDENEKTQLQLNRDGRLVEVVEVLPNVSKVNGMDPYKKESFTAKIVSMAIPRFKVAISPDGDEEGIEALGEVFRKTKRDLYELTGEAAAARYLLHARRNSFFATRPPARRYLFTRIPGYGPESVQAMVRNLDVIAGWEQVMELKNPDTSIKDSEIKVEFFRITEPGNYKDDAQAVVLPWWEPHTLPYQYDNGAWHQPAFRLRITNTGERKLWVSLLYLDDTFGITNQLIQSEELAPGAFTWAGDGQHHTIKIRLDNGYHDLGINRATDYLKLFICTEPFQTGKFNQKSLKLGRLDGGMRGLEFRKKPDKPDWATRDIAFDIYRPFPPAPARPGAPAALFDHLTLSVPEGVATLAALNTLEMAAKNLPIPLGGELEDRRFFTPAALEPTDSYFDVCVLELFQMTGADRVGAEAPIRMRFAEGAAIEEGLQPYGYDPATGRLSLLNYRREGRDFLLLELPGETPSTLEGMGASRKVFWEV